MSYEHPLAYLLGIEGLALLRGFTGDHDREFTEARIAEIRRLLDEPWTGVEVDRVGAADGYRIWSRTYDQPGNGAFAIDEPELRRIIDPLPPGTALDAACGTGRYARLLADRGHRVLGVDGSPEMLDHARPRVPEAEFRLGDLRGLPVDDASVDLVTCGLALTHLPDLTPAFAEFARVLRPGGHLVVVDMHPESVARGSIPSVRDQDGRPGRLPAHRHLVGDYLRAALPRGFQVRDCREPVAELGGTPEPADSPGPWDVWPWSLMAMVPEAARAVYPGSPVMLVWHFQLA
ncbi:class I SAM-dependent methyltransferase [Actinokineospora auranticolor]|uniref:Methyltransferase family protein n=1 Tax=Actinokineospora auranticolor TaxID=155976 RepID=A0A2S6GWZ1_9PSEU|nr:class I SAM-dependent methyltransferase [Actinokineospora auranticolor]PPK69744.1 methyltransferase family protein [Actinokineospora auranticolor]